jgi:hypothetical protein
MTRPINYRIFFIAVVALALVGVLATRVLAVPVLPVLLIVVAAALTNGFVAVLEDELPRGFGSPTGAKPLAWRRVASVSRWVLAVSLAALGLLSTAAAASGAGAKQVYAICGAATCALLVLALIAASKRFLWAAAVVLFAGLALSMALQSWWGTE